MNIDIDNNMFFVKSTKNYTIAYFAVNIKIKNKMFVFDYETDNIAIRILYMILILKNGIYLQLNYLQSVKVHHIYIYLTKQDQLSSAKFKTWKCHGIKKKNKRQYKWKKNKVKLKVKFNNTTYNKKKKGIVLSGDMICEKTSIMTFFQTTCKFNTK